MQSVVDTYTFGTPEQYLIVLSQLLSIESPQQHHLVPKELGHVCKQLKAEVRCDKFFSYIIESEL